MRKSNLIHGSTETEVKIRLPDRDAILERLKAIGCVESVPRTFESNVLYDTPDHRLQHDGTMLRLRSVGEKSVITWKGRKIAGPHKIRPELETMIGSSETLHEILTNIGFQPSFRYEKFRTEFQGAGRKGLVTVDETPIGLFLELEGTAEWIDGAARQLGFSESDYILDSYGRLYLADCEMRHVEPGDMTFGSGE